MAEKTWVSPGIYTSEQDLTYVTRQVGVTTLGLVGETTQGPAFQPIFVSNYGEFQSFFGGLNPTKIKDTGAPQYELGYIAKSYLTQSNQLFVTRVLGFSGYDAGYAWGITVDAAMDPSTYAQTTSGRTYSSLITYTATSGGTNLTLTSSDPLVQTLINNGLLTTQLSFLGSASTGNTSNISVVYEKTGTIFTGASFSLYVTSSTPYTASTIGYVSGTTSGVTIYYSGSSYAAYEDQLVVLLRSRGDVDNVTYLPDFEVTGTSVQFDPAYTAATKNPLGIFSLSGNSSVQGLFDYNVTLDKTQRNYIVNVLGRNAQPGTTALFIEEFYENMFANLNANGYIRGIKQNLVYYNTQFSDYTQQYSEAITPYIVSGLHGNKVSNLFRFHTISDGNSANEQIKISIVNIQPDELTFDLQIRSFFDTDANPVVLEGYSRCNMDPTSNNYIGRLVGTYDGVYPSNSSYVLIEMDDSTDTSAMFPAGFVGYPIRDYQLNSNSNVTSPDMSYKQTYGAFDNKRKFYLGLSDTVGIDVDFFDYKGTPLTTNPNIWTGMTNGFHMDVNASAATIDGVFVVINSSGGTYSPTFLFNTGNWVFTTDASLVGGPYAQTYARKFTLAPYGGFDGFDIYNTRRSNMDKFLINGVAGVAGLNSGAFVNRTLTSGDIGISSDYYAYLEAIWTFQNPDAININVFATPGIDDFDNQALVSEAIEMIEQDRADSIYIITTPDTDYSGNVLDANDVVTELNGLFDSNYSATFWPWVQINDTENNVYIFVPPTRDVVRNIALTDNISFPWFAAAGVNRGKCDCIKARTKVTLTARDTLYENRINPIATFTSDGVNIWGNKTLQVSDTALNRINVRRLLLQARKLISAVGIRLLFEQNDTVVRNQFLSLVNPILDNIRSERGLTDFRVVLSSSAEDLDSNQLTGQIFMIPTRSLEEIQIQFVVTNQGSSFENV